MNNKIFAISKYIESQILDLIIIGDDFSIYKIIKEALITYPDIKYILVIDKKENIISHTFDYPISNEIIKANGLEKNNICRIEKINTEIGLIDDFACPILHGTLGVIRIGASEDYIQNAIFELTKRLIIIISIVALLGGLISYLLAYILNKPVKKLVKGISEVRNGNFEIQIKPWFDDEIGILTKGFNEMVISIKKEYEAKNNLIRKLITIQEDERQKISRELHDVVGQVISSIKIWLKSIEPHMNENLKTKLEEFKKLLTYSLDEIRNISVELRPPLLNDFGLFKAIEEMCIELRDKFQMKVNYYVDNSLLNLRFSSVLEIGLYRCIQEIFSNIKKHSQASEVNINIIRDADLISLTIEDNGKGFDCNITNTNKDCILKHIGLMGIKERIEMFNGNFTLVSNIGKGTKIKLEVPIYEEKN